MKIDITLVDNSPLSEMSKTAVLSYINSLKSISFENHTLLNEIDSIAIDLVFVSDQQIKEINAAYRNTDKATDVITFSYWANLAENEPQFQGPDAEVYISIDTACRQSKRHGISLEEELALLIVHGVLHATGLDHENSTDEAKKMRMKEADILSQMGIKGVSPLTVTAN